MASEKIRLNVIRSGSTNPYNNLAAEENLTFNAKNGEVVLFLWQNVRTVVIGRNQNPWRECNVERMKADNVYLARRMSGGGAVYHDLGNLNFTFIAKEGFYDIGKQIEVILLACRLMGIKAELNGRNDLTVEGRKFSGHAYYSSEGYNYHHGTIMMDVAPEDMSKYLQVSESKLKSKGVESVKSRVVNLREYLPNMSREKMISSMQDALIRAFEKEYGGKAHEMEICDTPSKIVEKYSSEEWRLGTRIPFEKEICHRFDWGEVQVQLAMKGENISSCKIFSDSLETEAFAILEDLLTGCKYDAATIRHIKTSGSVSAISYEVLHLIASSIE
ncbi:MAG: lipoate--protein ligase [Clostridiales bacterium]|nr:lipoate--protein ligase [Clostridiales bacterium]